MANNSSEDGVMVAAMILTVIGSIVAGFLAWNYIQPKSFGGGIGFLIVWGIMSWLSTTIGSVIAFALFSEK
jgi:hypothetical protein